jgi:hypothetical protein
MQDLSKNYLNDTRFLQKKTYTLFDKIYIVYILLYAHIFPSAFMQFSNFLFSKLTTILFFSIVVFYVLTKKVAINKSYFLIICLYLFSACITAGYYQSASVLSIPIKFASLFAIFLLYDEKYTAPFIDISTIFISILLIGAYIGFLYALGGGRPLFEFPNVDGRTNYFFLTTGTNIKILNIIRPSGIYDEPGALSFFICAISLMRVLFHRNDLLTFVLLIAGVITFSLTHILILFVYALYYFSKYKKKKKIIWYLLIILIVCGYFYNTFQDELDQMLFSRFMQTHNDRIIAGDNRSGQLKKCFELLDAKVFFWGLDDIVYSNTRLMSKRYGDIGENPLSQIILYGIFIGWPYYIFLITISLAGLMKRNLFFIFIAIGMLYLQRPYISAMGYGFYFLFFLIRSLNTIKQYGQWLFLKKYPHLKYIDE